MLAAPEVKVWVLSDGKPGMENQCLGLAEALGFFPVIKRIKPRFPWSILPPHCWLKPLLAPGFGGDQLKPPWPSVLIATGRQTVAPALAIKKSNRGNTFCIQIQNPTIWHDHFDILVVPAHDRIRRENALITIGALNRITKEKLLQPSLKLRSTIDFLPRPLVAVLVGGSNKHYRMTNACTRSLADQLLALSTKRGIGLALTCSRRTSQETEDTLRTILSQSPSWFWDGKGENPYLGLLGLADAFVVTADSVSMISEACSTGKPVYIAALEGGSEKFEYFHEDLQNSGMTRPFNGTLANWEYPPLDETRRVAAEIKRRMGKTTINY